MTTATHRPRLAPCLYAPLSALAVASLLSVVYSSPAGGKMNTLTSCSIRVLAGRGPSDFRSVPV